MGQLLTVILDILDARELVNPRKILTGYKNYWQIIQGGVSSRRNRLGILQSSFVRIVKYDLKWHPCKMSVRRQLKVGIR